MISCKSTTSGSTSAVLARLCIRCRMRLSTTSQLDAERWYTIRPVYFAMDECRESTDLATRNDVFSYATECCGSRLDIELFTPPELSDVDEGCFARVIVRGRPDAMGGGSVTRASSVPPNSCDSTDSKS